MLIVTLVWTGGGSFESAARRVFPEREPVLARDWDVSP